MEQHDQPGDPAVGAEPEGTSRRRAIALGAGVAGAAWVAPSILSVDAASAATIPPPPPPSGILNGVVTWCGNPLSPGVTYLLTATQNPGGAVGSTTVPDTGIYSIGGLPAGSYDVVLHPNGTNTGGPDQTFPAAAVVPAGGSVKFSPSYSGSGC